MSVPLSSGTARRRYVVAAGMVVLAVGLGAVFGLIATRAIAGYEITPVDDPTGSTVAVGDRPLAVWVSPQTATTYCSTDDDGALGSEPQPSITLTDGSRTWKRVAIVRGEPGSQQRLSCTAESDLVIGTADTPRLTRYVVLGVALGGTAVLLVLAAFTIALVTAVRRRSVGR